MMNYFFRRDVSVAHCVHAVGVTYSIMKGHYLLAVAIFFIGVAVCLAGELYLERRA